MRWPAVILVCGILFGAPSIAGAQSKASAPAPSRQTHLYFGMWTTHLNADRRHIDTNNLMVGLTHGPVFAATFVNSFGRRAYAAGFQHAVLAKGNQTAAATLGIRVGAISGYDERFLSFAKDTPVLPMFSVYSLFEVKGLGVEASWTMVVASVAFAVRF